jgi:hypothetical protein
MDETIPMDGPHYEQISGILMGGIGAALTKFQFFGGCAAKTIAGSYVLVAMGK